MDAEQQEVLDLLVKHALLRRRESHRWFVGMLAAEHAKLLCATVLFGSLRTLIGLLALGAEPGSRVGSHWEWEQWLDPPKNQARSECVRLRLEHPNAFDALAAHRPDENVLRVLIGKLKNEEDMHGPPHMHLEFWKATMCLQVQLTHPSLSHVLALMQFPQQNSPEGLYRLHDQLLAAQRSRSARLDVSVHSRGVQVWSIGAPQVTAAQMSVVVLAAIEMAFSREDELDLDFRSPPNGPTFLGESFAALSARVLCSYGWTSQDFSEGLSLHLASAESRRLLNLRDADLEHVAAALAATCTLERLRLQGFTGPVTKYCEATFAPPDVQSFCLNASPLFLTYSLLTMRLQGVGDSFLEVLPSDKYSRMLEDLVDLRRHRFNAKAQLE